MRRHLVQLALAASIGALLAMASLKIAEHEELPRDPPAELVDSDYALELCKTAGVRQGGEDAELLAAFDSTAGEIADWMLSGPPEAPKGLNSFIEEQLLIGRDAPVMVCYFDRDEGYYPSVPPGYLGPPINRIRVLVDKNGGSVPDAVGTQGDADHPGMRVVRPGADSRTPD